MFKIILCFLSGIAAGLGTGFAGMSAAAAISPMLITFLGMPAYDAVGIALASDVLASGVSAYTYKKNKNLDIKNGIVILITVLIFTAIGSLIASHVSNTTMGNFSVIMTLILGIKFIIKPVMNTIKNLDSLSKSRRIISSILCGTLIGFICGFVGAGGGMMMLLVLTTVLGYELKTAVGTSVFVMAFTALTGAISHFAIGGLPDLTCLITCVLSTLLWARIAAKIANKSDALTLNRITGIILIIISISILAVELF